MINADHIQIVKNSLAFLFLLIFTLLSSGCALFGSKEDVDPNDQTLSVVYGHFDLEEAPSWGGLDWVSIKQYKPKPAYYGTDVQDGLFFHIGVSNNSSIQVDTFGRNTRWFSNVNYSYQFGGQGKNDTALVIKKPGVYYLGSYKYKPIDSGSFFKQDSFDMEKSDNPSEKALLTRLLKYIKRSSDYRDYTHQIAMLEKRLAKLK